MMLARLFHYGISSCLLITLLACSGGGGDDPPPPAPPANVAGSWTVTETGTNNNCGDPIASPYVLTVAQNGSALTVTAPAGVFSGSINGNTVSWTGSYPEDGGTTTITSLTATVSGNTFSGSSNWSWSGPGGPCSGSTTFTGTRSTTVAEVEPNNSRAAGQAVTRPLTLQGSASELDTGETVSSTGTVQDWYRFTLTGTTTVTVTLTFSLGTVSNDLDLFLMQGNTLLGSSTGVASSETITRSLGAGTYEVGVKAFDTPAGAVAYTLTIQ